MNTAIKTIQAIDASARLAKQSGEPLDVDLVLMNTELALSATPSEPLTAGVQEMQAEIERLKAALDFNVKQNISLMKRAASPSPEAGKGGEGLQWVSVEDKPLFITTPLGWECTEDGEGEFLAALQYNDTRHPGKDLWWIKLCTVEDGLGLCVVSDEGNESAPWDLSDVTHYCKVSEPTPTPVNKTDKI